MDNISETTDYQKAEKLFVNGDFSAALNAFLSHSKVDPCSIDCCLYIFNICQKLNQAELIELACEQIFKIIKIDQNYLDQETLMVIIENLNYRSSDQLIIDFCRTLIELYQNNSLLVKKIADAHLYKGRVREALILYKKLILSDPVFTKIDNKKVVYESVQYKEELIEFNLEALSAELSNFEKEILKLPIDLCSKIKYANNSAIAGDFVASLNLYNQITNQLPDSFYAFYNQGLILDSWRRITGREDLFDSTLQSFATAVSLELENAQAWYQLGKLLVSVYPKIPDWLPQLPEAQDCLKFAIKLNPDYEAAYFEMGVLAYQDSRFKDSSDYFTRYNILFEERIAKHPIGSQGIRFMPRETTNMIGHIAGFLDATIKSQKLGWIPQAKWVVLAPDGFTANRYYLNCWQKYCEIVSDPSNITSLLKLRRELSQKVPLITRADGRTAIPRLYTTYVEKEWEKQNRSALLHFPKEDLKTCWNQMEKLGVPKGGKFVALHVRGAGYKGELAGSYFDRTRNADIDTYMQAVEAIAKQGWYVVRMGEPGNKPAPKHPALIEYCFSEFKSEMMDIFLASQCQFLLSNGSGMILVSPTFGVPHASANYQTTFLQYPSRDIFIPKLLWSRKDNRYLTFQELSRPPYAQQDIPHHFVKNEIDFIDNSVEDVLELAQEMIERVEKRVIYSNEDQTLQEKYNSLWRGEFGISICRIGREFIRKYKYLLD